MQKSHRSLTLPSKKRKLKPCTLFQFEAPIQLADMMQSYMDRLTSEAEEKSVDARVAKTLMEGWDSNVYESESQKLQSNEPQFEAILRESYETFCHLLKMDNKGQAPKPSEFLQAFVANSLAAGFPEADLSVEQKVRETFRRYSPKQLTQYDSVSNAAPAPSVLSQRATNEAIAKSMANVFQKVE